MTAIVDDNVSANEAHWTQSQQDDLNARVEAQLLREAEDYQDASRPPVTRGLGRLATRRRQIILRARREGDDR